MGYLVYKRKRLSGLGDKKKYVFRRGGDLCWIYSPNVVAYASSATSQFRRKWCQSILEAGRLSPSGGNEQSWKFGVLTDKDLIAQVAEAAYNQRWLKSAPLLIVLVTVIVAAERGGRDVQAARFPHLAAEFRALDNELYGSLNMEEHQTKIPGTHMVLQALSAGIYSTWVSYFDVTKVGSLLHLPADSIASEIIAFGYPDSPPKIQAKKSLEQLVFYNLYQP